MTNYELLFVLPGTLAETEVATSLEKVKTMITDGGVADLVVHDVGKNRLAYPINHIRYGYFSIARFSAEESAINAIKEKLRLSGEVLRMLLQKVAHDHITDPKIVFSVPSAGKDLTMPELADVPMAIHTPVEKVAVKAPVTMEEIGEKLDEILDKEIEI